MTSGQAILLRYVLVLALAGTGCLTATACAPKPWPAGTLPDKLDLPKASQITQAWSCKDRLGEQLVVATRSPGSPGSPTEGARTTELTFSKYRQTATGWKKDWQARDFLNAPPASMAPELILLGDYDGDGQADVFLAYALPGPPAQSDEGKLLVFYKDQKYAIRGAVAHSPTDFGSRKTSANFLTLPQAIQERAFRLWDKLNSPRH
ncbi:MAG TPA: hypothetical protein VFW93_01005 [Aquabacterium sp.]|uniref:M949_RS01915 family surface polysaccharide biosynthesis protein n=1 Tax=Aquabacterium sp. TaxID=1872578 RepID=UPI002E36E7CD|nr:hypothetical protein [Aquabacterium sp.]HEX5354764.1 hypothetical protein [Aquabacterium sp.]